MDFNPTKSIICSFNKLLDSIFGNKVVIVKGYTLRHYCRFEREFIFHKKTDRNTISLSLREKFDYAVIEAKSKRTKEHVSPMQGTFNVLTDEKVVRFFD